MNKVTLMGRLTRDPEIREGNNLTVCRFGVACDRGKDSNGQDRGADFINCVAFGNTASIIGKFFKKGRPILIDGHINVSQYQTKDGENRNDFSVVVDRFEFAPKDNSEADEAPKQKKQAQPKPKATAQPSIDDFMEYEDEDDLPF